MLRLLAIFVTVTQLVWPLDVTKVAQSGLPFAPYVAVPVMNRGYLFPLKHGSPELDVFTPDGHLVFATILTAPNGATPSLTDAAVNDDRTVAVSIVYRAAPDRFEGAIVLLNPSGKQTSTFTTGKYMPSHVTFGPGDTIWTRGWQRTPDPGYEDKEDYGVIRRFNMSGKQTGSFVKRSSFPLGLAPGGAWGGRWGIRTAGDHIGTLMYSGKVGDHYVWVELDSSGAELGRWSLSPGHKDGFAFTPDGLYTVINSWNNEQGRGNWQLAILDKPSSTWRPISTINYTRENICHCGILMDADGNQLVFAKEAGAIIEWVKP